MAKESLIGVTFGGRFQVTGFLGEGGMGRIYEATDLQSDGMVVALKVLHKAIADDPEVAFRFKREMRAAARVQHPNSVAVYDFGDADGRLFLSMECVEGDSLGEVILDDAPLSIERAVSIGRQIAAALGAAHSRRIVHRDLKPDNVMIEDPGGRDIVKVCDFGLAKFMSTRPGGPEMNNESTEPAIEADTEHPKLVGTPHYMSPEYIQTGIADHRADIYALGVLLYEMVTGRPPFDGAPYEILDAHVKELPLTPKTINDTVPDWLDTVIIRLLDKDPDRRPAIAEEVMVLLDTQRSGIDDDEGDPLTGEGTLHGPPAVVKASKGPASIAPPSRGASNLLPLVLLGFAALLFVFAFGFACLGLGTTLAS